MLISDFSQLAKLIEPVALCNLYFFKPIESFSIDSRTIKKGCAYIALKGQHKDGHEFIHEAVRKGAAAVVCEHDISPRPKVPFFIVSDSYRALRDIAAYVRKVKKPFVCAITGSVGKTTTKEMLGAIMACDTSLVKNIKTENNILGVAKTIFSLRDEKTVVLELGTNHPGEIAELSMIARPQIGVITFVKPVHLEGFGSMQGILKEKTALFHANPKMKVVLNRDDAYLRRLKRAKIHWFGMSRDSDVYARVLSSTLEESVFLINDMYTLRLSSPFEGFIYNALAALTASTLMGVRLKDAVGRLSNFKEFPFQRLQITSTDEYLYVNDAYNSNPYSLQESLKFLDRFTVPKIAVLGDMLELGEKTVYYHTQIAKSVLERNFDYIYTVGESTMYLVKALKDSGHSHARHCENAQEIATAIRKHARQGSLIFLKGSRKMELEKVMQCLQDNKGLKSKAKRNTKELR